MKKKIPLQIKIILGMVFGVSWGLFAVYFGFGEFTTNWIKPWGAIFINLLKVIAVPLIFVSLVKGVSSLKDISKLSSMGLKTLSIYLLTTVISISLGLILVNIIQPGNSFPESKKQELREKYAGTIEQKEKAAKDLVKKSPIQFLVDIFPENIFRATTDNSNMLQVICMALLFGVAMLMIPPEKTINMIDMLDTINDIILKIIDMIMMYAPFGVFALISSIIVEFAGDSLSDSLDLFKALGLYSLTVLFGLLCMVYFVYPVFLKIFTKVNLKHFFKGIFPAQMLAFSTSSSAATLPVTMEQCENELKISKSVTSFVLPVGATVNMDGTSLYQAIAAVFIAQAFGYNLDLSQQMNIILTATLASIGSAAVPGAGIIMLVIVLNSIGVATEGIALIFAVDRILDMFRTVVNVTGDSTVAYFINYTENKKQKI
ncbi:MAG: dicarboxylate/amino acid:cation symporter [Leptospiraceae bacterium]|nr:dicarboxylate/amino acid:cation symporter [Leptospiraceae bacterium]MCP5496040.1 dicarboxylate/amino acid:cation symporter [Leptospiraceae bacterium]